MILTKTDNENDLLICLNILEHWWLSETVTPIFPQWHHAAITNNERIPQL